MVSIDKERPHPNVRVEDGYAVIRIPLCDVHGLRVALAECPCRGAKSNATRDIRQGLAYALSRVRGA